jgi:hypothetical protein
MDSAATIIYTFLLLFFFLYLFAVLGVEVLSKPVLLDDQRRGETDYDQEVYEAIVRRHFYDIFSTMITLIQFVNLDSAHEIYKPLILSNHILVFYFVPFVLVVSVALMNLVTAVIVSRAIEEGKDDRLTLRKWEMEQKSKDVLKLQTLFTKLDIDGDGTLTLDELMNADRRVLQLLYTMCNTEDLPALFHTIDLDDSGSVGIEEFCAGLLRFMKERNLDFMRMDKCTQRTLAHVRDLQAGFGLETETQFNSPLSPKEPLTPTEKETVICCPCCGAIGRNPKRIARTLATLSTLESKLRKLEWTQAVISGAVLQSSEMNGSAVYAKLKDMSEKTESDSVLSPTTTPTADA